MVQIKDANIELHVHPRLDINSMEDVLKAMDKTGLHILGLSALDESIFPYVREEVKRIYGAVKSDEAGIVLPNGNLILNVREYSTQEELHVLTAGYAYDQATPQTEIEEIINVGLKHNALVLLDHPFVDNVHTKTAGHISDDLEGELTDICGEYPGKIALEWNGYCKPWIRWVLKDILNTFGYKTNYYDVNDRIEQLSKWLETRYLKRKRAPVLADTDLHARNKKALMAMGTARFITDVEGETAAEVVDSMKKNIFAGNYRNVKRYVSSWHMLRYFCLPVLFDKLFKKPRA